MSFYEWLTILKAKEYILLKAQDLSKRKNSSKVPPTPRAYSTMYESKYKYTRTYASIL